MKLVALFDAIERFWRDTGTGSPGRKRWFIRKAMLPGLHARSDNAVLPLRTLKVIRRCGMEGGGGSDRYGGTGPPGFQGSVHGSTAGLVRLVGL